MYRCLLLALTLVATLQFSVSQGAHSSAFLEFEIERDKWLSQEADDPVALSYMASLVHKNTLPAGEAELLSNGLRGILYDSLLLATPEQARLFADDKQARRKGVSQLLTALGVPLKSDDLVRILERLDNSNEWHVVSLQSKGFASFASQYRSPASDQKLLALLGRPDLARDVPRLLALSWLATQVTDPDTRKIVQGLIDRSHLDGPLTEAEVAGLYRPLQDPRWLEPASVVALRRHILGRLATRLYQIPIAHAGGQSKIQLQVDEYFNLASFLLDWVKWTTKAAQQIAAEPQRSHPRARALLSRFVTQPGAHFEALKNLAANDSELFVALHATAENPNDIGPWNILLKTPTNRDQSVKLVESFLAPQQEHNWSIPLLKLFETVYFPFDPNGLTTRVLQPILTAPETNVVRKELLSQVYANQFPGAWNHRWTLACDATRGRKLLHSVELSARPITVLELLVAVCRSLPGESGTTQPQIDEVYGLLLAHVYDRLFVAKVVDAKIDDPIVLQELTRLFEPADHSNVKIGHLKAVRLFREKISATFADASSTQNQERLAAILVLMLRICTATGESEPLTDLARITGIRLFGVSRDTRFRVLEVDQLEKQAERLGKISPAILDAIAAVFAPKNVQPAAAFGADDVRTSFREHLYFPLIKTSAFLARTSKLDPNPWFRLAESYADPQQRSQTFASLLAIFSDPTLPYLNSQEQVARMVERCCHELRIQPWLNPGSLHLSQNLNLPLFKRLLDQTAADMQEPGFKAGIVLDEFIKHLHDDRLWIKAQTYDSAGRLQRPPDFYNRRDLTTFLSNLLLLDEALAAPFVRTGRVFEPLVPAHYHYTPEAGPIFDLPAGEWQRRALPSSRRLQLWIAWQALPDNNVQSVAWHRSVAELALLFPNRAEHLPPALDEVQRDDELDGYRQEKTWLMQEWTDYLKKFSHAIKPQERFEILRLLMRLRFSLVPHGSPAPVHVLQKREKASAPSKLMTNNRLPAPRERAAQWKPTGAPVRDRRKPRPSVLAENDNTFLDVVSTLETDQKSKQLTRVLHYEWMVLERASKVTSKVAATDNELLAQLLGMYVHEQKSLFPNDQQLPANLDNMGRQILLLSRAACANEVLSRVGPADVIALGSLLKTWGDAEVDSAIGKDMLWCLAMALPYYALPADKFLAVDNGQDADLRLDRLILFGQLTHLAKQQASKWVAEAANHGLSEPERTLYRRLIVAHNNMAMTLAGGVFDDSQLLLACLRGKTYPIETIDFKILHMHRSQVTFDAKELLASAVKGCELNLKLLVDSRTVPINDQELLAFLFPTRQRQASQEGEAGPSLSEALQGIVRIAHDPRHQKSSDKEVRAAANQFQEEAKKFIEAPHVLGWFDGGTPVAFESAVSFLLTCEAAGDEVQAVTWNNKQGDVQAMRRDYEKLWRGMIFGSGPVPPWRAAFAQRFCAVADAKSALDSWRAQRALLQRIVDGDPIRPQLTAGRQWRGLRDTLAKVDALKFAGDDAPGQLFWNAYSEAAQAVIVAAQLGGGVSDPQMHFLAEMLIDRSTGCTRPVTPQEVSKCLIDASDSEPLFFATDFPQWWDDHYHDPRLQRLVGPPWADFIPGDKQRLGLCGGDFGAAPLQPRSYREALWGAMSGYAAEQLDPPMSSLLTSQQAIGKDGQTIPSRVSLAVESERKVLRSLLAMVAFRSRHNMQMQCLQRRSAAGVDDPLARQRRQEAWTAFQIDSETIRWAKRQVSREEWRELAAIWAPFQSYALNRDCEEAEALGMTSNAWGDASARDDIQAYSLFYLLRMLDTNNDRTSYTLAPFAESLYRELASNIPVIGAAATECRCDAQQVEVIGNIMMQSDSDRCSKDVAAWSSLPVWITLCDPSRRVPLVANPTYSYSCVPGHEQTGAMIAGCDSLARVVLGKAFWIGAPSESWVASYEQKMSLISACGQVMRSPGPAPAIETIRPALGCLYDLLSRLPPVATPYRPRFNGTRFECVEASMKSVATLRTEMISLDPTTRRSAVERSLDSQCLLQLRWDESGKCEPVPAGFLGYVDLVNELKP